MTPGTAAATALRAGISLGPGTTNKRLNCAHPRLKTIFHSQTRGICSELPQTCCQLCRQLCRTRFPSARFATIGTYSELIPPQTLSDTLSSTLSNVFSPAQTNAQRAPCPMTHSPKPKRANAYSLAQIPPTRRQGKEEFPARPVAGAFRPANCIQSVSND